MLLQIIMPMEFTDLFTSAYIFLSATCTIIQALNVFFSKPGNCRYQTTGLNSLLPRPGPCFLISPAFYTNYQQQFAACPIKRLFGLVPIRANSFLEHISSEKILLSHPLLYSKCRSTTKTNQSGSQHG
ncbi:hypothetical protein BDV19DRAFT_359377, partial [Aspergillus venezuelensis]